MNLKEYFKETPREQVLEDWRDVCEKTKDVNSPTVKEFLEGSLLLSNSDKDLIDGVTRMNSQHMDELLSKKK